MLADHYRHAWETWQLAVASGSIGDNLAPVSESERARQELPSAHR
jgi:hypothetical protein